MIGIGAAVAREDTVAVLVKSSHDVLTIVLEMESALEVRVVIVTFDLI